MINRAALVCGSETKGPMTSNLERRYEGIHQRPVSSFLLLSQRGGRVNGPGANEQVRGDATVRLGYNRDVSGQAVTDHPELMFLTIAGPARCYATSALPPAMTREMKHQIGFVIPSRIQGRLTASRHLMFLIKRARQVERFLKMSDLSHGPKWRRVNRKRI